MVLMGRSVGGWQGWRWTRCRVGGIVGAVEARGGRQRSTATDACLRWVVLTVWVVTVVLVVMALVLLAMNGPAPSFGRIAAAHGQRTVAAAAGALCTLAFATVGATIVWHRRRQVVGWLFCLVGVALAVQAGAAAGPAVLLPVVPRRPAARAALAAGGLAGWADPGDGDRRAGPSSRSAGGAAVGGQPARRVWDGGASGGRATGRGRAAVAPGRGGIGRVADRPSAPCPRGTAPAAQVVRQRGGLGGCHRHSRAARAGRRPDQVGRRRPCGADHRDRLPAGVGRDRDPAVPPVRHRCPPQPCSGLQHGHQHVGRRLRRDGPRRRTGARWRWCGRCAWWTGWRERVVVCGGTGDAGSRGDVPAGAAVGAGRGRPAVQPAPLQRPAHGGGIRGAAPAADRPGRARQRADRRGRPDRAADPGVAMAAADRRRPLQGCPAHWRRAMSIRGRTVVVAGGGIAGMAAALLLAKTGALVTVVERVAAPEAVGAGLVLQPNGLAVLRELGRASCRERV